MADESEANALKVLELTLERSGLTRGATVGNVQRAYRIGYNDAQQLLDLRDACLDVIAAPPAPQCVCGDGGIPHEFGVDCYYAIVAATAPAPQPAPVERKRIEYPDAVFIERTGPTPAAVEPPPEGLVALVQRYQQAQLAHLGALNTVGLTGPLANAIYTEVAASHKALLAWTPATLAPPATPVATEDDGA